MDAAPLERPFGTVSGLLQLHAAGRPAHPAIVEGERHLGYAALDRLVDGFAAALQREGVRVGDSVALCAANSTGYAVAFLGTLRAGAAAALIPPTLTADSIERMVRDAGAARLFREADLEARALDGFIAGARVPTPAAVTPDAPFNIIYSSGTTGEPKGIVQPCSMRWAHMQRGPAYGYAPDAVTLISTPLYSNTTLVSFFPALALGGTVVLAGKFDAGAWLALAERHRATHAMLVPVQYQRLMACADFDRFDLASFRMKLSTSAPFAVALKRDVLARWPGSLIEWYGMTEGGCTCVLRCNDHRDKLHTVGVPAAGVDARLIDEQGRELPRGETGEVVGRSAAMMTGYRNRPEETARAEWFDAEGRRYIRTGDVGRFDEDGFLTLLDRRKDLIISGGFNIYPSDLEAVLRTHPAVADVSVAGVPSLQWGETPVAFVVAKGAAPVDAGELRKWANARLGKVQRLEAVVLVDELPRNAIGKVLKRELRERYASGAESSIAKGAGTSRVSPR